MRFGRFCHSDNLDVEDAVRSGTLLVQFRGSKVKIVSSNHQDLIGFICGGDLNFSETFDIRKTVSFFTKSQGCSFSLLLGVRNLLEKIIAAVLVDLTETDPDTVGDLGVVDVQLGHVLVPGGEVGEQGDDVGKIQSISGPKTGAGHATSGAGSTTPGHGGQVGTDTTRLLVQVHPELEDGLLVLPHRVHLRVGDADHSVETHRLNRNCGGNLGSDGVEYSVQGPETIGLMNKRGDETRKQNHCV